MAPNHHGVYQQALAYDVAFGFRDVAAECDTLSALFQRHAGGAAASVLELAAGPARHAREFARRGLAATALDVVPAMCLCARERAAREGVALETVCADMCSFTLPRRCDLALLLDSASYLLDNDAVLRHLACVAAQLNDGGLYVLELAHPRDAFRTGTASTKSQWTREGEGLRVDVQWGADSDAFDPITQVDAVTVKLAWAGPAGSGQLVETAHQRRYTANEFDALVRASGAFDIVEWLGAMAPPLAFDNQRSAWRMVPVLRRRA